MMVFTRDGQPAAGEFQHAETKVHFTYRPTSDAWALSRGLTHEIDVCDGVRYAYVRTTVAHVAVDEAADGSPVCERWSLTRHHVYPVATH